MKPIAFILFFGLLASSCSDSGNSFDASGSFEAREIIVSALANGQIMALDLEEGLHLQADQMVGYIDSTQLHLQKKQLRAQIDAVLSRRPNIATQMAALERQIKAAHDEKIRVENLVRSDAAPSKQLDDINNQIAVLEKQLEAQRSALQINSNGIASSALPLYVQIEMLDNRIAQHRVVNPISGTVIAQFTEAKEVAAMGKPLYKIADLSEMYLRVFISGDQLAKVKLGQKVKVFTDNGEGGFNEAEGQVDWINDKAEFTPKTIQTKNERANLVYALKVKVKNQGQYKIGMYGEIKL